jgi:hypothetical protein
MALVDPEISRRKLTRELAAWDVHAEIYRRRGYFIVGRADLEVDVAFTARIPLSSMTAPLPTIIACARFAFDNYDVWPPSITFIDAFDRTPILPPVGAFDFGPGKPRMPDGTPLNAIVQGHPETRLPFLCQRGVREYHRHPEHSGDDWLLHRGGGLSGLAPITDRIWHQMARNVAGFRLDAQAAPAPFQGGGILLSLVQRDADEALREANAQAQAQQAQMLAAMQAQPGQMAPGHPPAVAAPPASA